MAIGELFSSGAVPVLEMSVRFAAQRQRLIAHNIANFETPDFRPMDVSVKGFQKMLSEAVEARRSTGSGEGELEWHETDEVQRADGDGIVLTPKTASNGILFHDRNNRDLERTMQDLAENASAYRVASDFLRTRFELLRAAIAQRA